MNKIATCAFLFLFAGAALAKGPSPEDLLKGRIIISDKRLPTSWNSVSSYVQQLKALNKESLWYDKKSGKLTVQYAAFFARPVNDVQVMLTLTDITRGAHTQKATTEQFLSKGDRVLFNAVEFDKEDIEGNKKYLMTIATRGQVIAQGTFILREEGPHYSGKVTFSEDETKPSGNTK
jgi:hypothetical protein